MDLSPADVAAIDLMNQLSNRLNDEFFHSLQGGHEIHIFRASSDLNDALQQISNALGQVSDPIKRRMLDLVERWVNSYFENLPDDFLAMYAHQLINLQIVQPIRNIIEEEIDIFHITPAEPPTGFDNQDEEPEEEEEETDEEDEPQPPGSVSVYYPEQEWWDR